MPLARRKNCHSCSLSPCLFLAFQSHATPSNLYHQMRSECVDLLSTTISSGVKEMLTKRENSDARVTFGGSRFSKVLCSNTPPPNNRTDKYVAQSLKNSIKVLCMTKNRFKLYIFNCIIISWGILIFM